MKPEEKLRISLLLEFYGSMLSERQNELMEFYYNDDLSLSEIAENTGITRQGARDGINKACAFLNETEEKLRMLSSWQERDRLASAIKIRLKDIGADKEDIIEAIDRMRG